MRKRLLIALGATVALVAAATAYAAFTASGIATTTGTFATATASDVKTRQCTGGDGKAFTITDAKFTGTATIGNPAIVELSGPATFRIRTTVDDASHLGVVDGSVKVKDDDTGFHGRFTGTLDSGGKFQGFFIGDGHRDSKAKVFGTLSGQFAGNTGFVSPGAALGTNSASTALAVIAGPVCKKSHESKPPRPNPPAPHNKRFDIHGTISALGGSPVSITVTGKGPTTATCSTDGSSPSTAGFAVNDKVRMKCEQISSVWTLRELKKDAH
jgi:hypothetical protein